MDYKQSVNHIHFAFVFETNQKYQICCCHKNLFY